MRGRILAVVCAVLVGAGFTACNAYVWHDYSLHMVLRQSISGIVQEPLPEWGEIAILVISDFMVSALVAVLAYILFERIFATKRNAS